MPSSLCNFVVPVMCGSLTRLPQNILIRQTLKIAAVAVITSLATVAATKAPAILDKVTDLVASKPTSPAGFW